MNKTILIFGLSFSFFLSACYKDFDASSTEVTTTYPEVESDTWLITQTDGLEEGEIYSLEMGSNTHTFSETNALFALDNVSKYDPLIFIKKDDELISFAKPLLLEFDVNLIELKAFPPNSTVNQLNGTIDLSSNISLETNELVFTDGGGNSLQDVFLKVNSIEDKTSLNQIGKHAYDRLGVLQVLNPIELLYVAPGHANAETLNLSSGDFYLNISPATNEGVFFLDVNSGKWIEVDASEQGLTDFGYYLFAEKEQGTFIEGKVSYESKGIAYEAFSMALDAYEYIGHTSSKGRFLSIAPLNKSLNFHIEDPCGNVTNEALVTSSEHYLSYANIDLVNGNHYLPLKTEIINCSGQKVSQPLINLVQNNGKEHLRFFIDPAVDVFISSCAEEILIQAVDDVSFEKGPAIPWQKEWDDELTNLSNCSDHKIGYSYLKINDEVKIYEPFESQDENEQLALRDPDNKFVLFIDGNTRGDYQEEDVHLIINDPEFGETGYFMDCASSAFGCGIETCFLSHDGTDEEGWLRIRFEGTLWMQTISPPSVGYFDVEGLILTK